MTYPARTLWPEGLRRRWPQLAFALVAAPVVLAGAVALVGFVIYWMSEPETGLATQLTGWSAVWLLIVLVAFTLSFGLAGVALLWALGRRGALAWLVAGAGAGALFAAAVGAASGRGVVPFHLVVAAGLGVALFALIRWFAGVRGG